MDASWIHGRLTLRPDATGRIAASRQAARSRTVRAKKEGAAPRGAAPTVRPSAPDHGLMNSSVAFGIVGVASSMLFTKLSRSARSAADSVLAIVPLPSL